MGKRLLYAGFELSNVSLCLILDLSLDLVDLCLSSHLDGLHVSLVHGDPVSHRVVQDTLRVVSGLLHVAHGELSLSNLLLVLEGLPIGSRVAEPRIDDNWVEAPVDELLSDGFFGVPDLSLPTVVTVFSPVFFVHVAWKV